MPWTVKITNKELSQNDTKLTLDVLYENIAAGKSYPGQLVFTGKTTLEQVTREVVTSFQRGETLKNIHDTLPAVNELLDISGVIAPPSQDDIDRNVFELAHIKYLAAERAVALGYILDTDALYIQAKSDAQAKFQAKFWQTVLVG